MALIGSGPILSESIRTALVAAGYGNVVTADFKNIWDVIAVCIVDHIRNEAAVTGTATGAMGGGPGVPVEGTVL